jgi:KTSC domain
MATFENSSHIREANWDGGVLTVTFKGGERYEFYDVPSALLQEMQAAPSAGRFFNSEIKGRYESAKV